MDELGYLPLETEAAHLFFQLVSRRSTTESPKTLPHSPTLRLLVTSMLPRSSLPM